MYVMQISTHHPELCPAFNKETKKATLTVMQQMDSLLAKHGIKPAGMWNDHPAHTVYLIFDTPTMEDYLALLMEPEMMAMMAFSTAEQRVVMGPQEIQTMLARD